MRPLAILTLLPLCSCAALFAPKSAAVAIDSDPQGAIISYRGHDVGRTPASVTIRNESLVVTLRAEGCHPLDVDVGSIGNGAYVFFGVFMWGPFELIADAASGAWSHPNDAPVRVELAPDSGPPLPPWVRPVRYPPSWIGGDVPPGGRRP